MVVTILGITAFQIYWLNDTYKREKRILERTSFFAFRETIHTLQASKLRLDRFMPDSTLGKHGKDHQDKGRSSPKRKMLGLINVLRDRTKDSLLQKTLLFEDGDTGKANNRGRQNRFLQFLQEVDSLQDTLSVAEIHQAYSRRMDKQNTNVPFSISKIQKKEDDDADFNEVTIGFSNPVTYKLKLGNTFGYLMKRIDTSIILSLFIITFTILSFVLMYRNLVRQRRLGEIKNDFISNITHELKTPIATVSVAIEALRNFNAKIDAQRTKEYLDISHNELQRLSLLVDKVLKLSMFEKQEVDLKYEVLNMQDLVKEVTSSMRLQFEKHKAVVNVSAEGDTMLEADRLHLVSVIFNLLDNALKYSRSSPVINITISGKGDKASLVIADNGIGIPQEYHDKIFEKFFRVPTGNLHNAKGYGLGLSYVAHVINKHKGTIEIQSSEDKGSKFVITLPKQKA